MKPILPLLFVLTAGALGCSQNQKWEGKVRACTEGRADSQALLILDAPASPNPTGWFGIASATAQDTWTMTEIKDAEAMGPNVKFKAIFDREFLEQWTVDVEGAGPTEFKGKVQVELTVPTFRATQVSQCLITLKLQS